MGLTAKNILLNVCYYGLTIVILPWAVLRLEANWGLVRRPSGVIRIASVLAALAGAVLQVWCIVLFQTSGRGTPSPALAPKKLVTNGPYGWVSNPMNIGELMVFIALSGWFASPLLLAYAFAGALAFHIFIVVWEERYLLDRFGSEYVEYRTGVNRWIPRLKRAMGDLD